MCPACIGSALYALTGAGSAGGVVMIAWKALRRAPRDRGSTDEQQTNLPSVDRDHRGQKSHNGQA